MKEFDGQVDSKKVFLTTQAIVYLEDEVKNKNNYNNLIVPVNLNRLVSVIDTMLIVQHKFILPKILDELDKAPDERFETISDKSLKCLNFDYKTNGFNLYRLYLTLIKISNIDLATNAIIYISEALTNAIENRSY